MKKSICMVVSWMVLLSFVSLAPVWATSETVKEVAGSVEHVVTGKYRMLNDFEDDFYLEYDQLDQIFYFNYYGNSEHIGVNTQGETTKDTRFGNLPGAHDGNPERIFLDVYQDEARSFVRTSGLQGNQEDRYWIDDYETMHEIDLSSFDFISDDGDMTLKEMRWKGDTIVFYKFEREEEKGFFRVGTLADFSNGTTDVFELGNTEAFCAFDLSEDGKMIYYMTLFETDDSYGTCLYGLNLETKVQTQIRVLPNKKIGTEDECPPSGSLYCTADAIVYSYQYEDLPGAVVEKIDFSGKLLEQVVWDNMIYDLEAGSQGETYFAQLNPDEGYSVTGGDKYTKKIDVYRIDWESAEPGSEAGGGSGRMKPLVRERSVSGIGVAQVENNRFNLLHPIDGQGNRIVDCALLPLRSIDPETILRIEYGDIEKAKEAGCQSVLVVWKGHEVSLPLDEFCCQEAASLLPGSESKWVECRLLEGEDGSVTHSMQWLVVEQVKTGVKCVHRIGQ